MNDLASLLKDLPVGLFLTDKQGRVTSYNKAAMPILGLDGAADGKDATTGWRFYRADGVELEPTETENGLFSPSLCEDTRVLIEQPNGVRREMLVRRTPIQDDTGAIVGAINLLTDAAEQIAAERQTAELAAIVEGSDDAIIGKTLDGVITTWNHGAARLFGYRPEEMIGKSILQIIPEALRTEERQILDQIGKGRRVEPFDTVRIAKDGRSIPISLTVSPLRNQRGEIIGASKIARDISERVKAQESIALLAERFRLLAKATNDVIRDWDIQAGTIWWNEGLTNVFGYAPEAFGAGVEAWKTRIHPGDRERVIAGIEAIIAGRGIDWKDDYRFLKADGTWAHVIDRVFLVRDQQGEGVRIVGSMLDVTERREIDARLRQSQKLEAVGQLTGGVAHDFNNLLTVILGNAEALAESLSHDERLRVLAEMTTTAAERAAELTSRLLAFSRKQPLEPKVVDINKLVSGLDPMLRRTLGEHIAIETIRGGGLWRAMIDPNQLENAILNLAINARDAMPSGGRLTFETANVSLDEAYAGLHEEVTAGKYVMIAISDTGTGMDPATARRAFEPFFTTKEIGRGSGLGLSMVFGFVKQSLGHIKIYSEVGLGTTVKVYLPRAYVQSEAGDLPEPWSQPSLGVERVLLVEDDPLVRSHVSEQLKSLGYSVISVDNAAKALEALKQSAEFDLLFTDVVIPGGMNGRQLADAARILKPKLPILFTSGYTENAIVHHGRLDPGVHLLNKPYRKAELAAKVRSVIDEHK